MENGRILHQLSLLASWLGLFFFSLSAILLARTRKNALTNFGERLWTRIVPWLFAISSIWQSVFTMMKLKNKGGIASPAVWGVAAFGAVAFAIVPLSNHFGAHPVLRYQNVYVVKTLTDYSYWLRINGNVTYANFCRDDNQPPFDRGETIKVLSVRDYGDCWSLKDVHPAYVMERDEKGNLIRRDN